MLNPKTDSRAPRGDARRPMAWYWWWIRVAMMLALAVASSTIDARECATSEMEYAIDHGWTGMLDCDIIRRAAREAGVRLAEDPVVYHTFGGGEQKLNWIWYALPIIGHSTDAVGTIVAKHHLGSRGHEVNVLYFGGHPSDGRIILIKATECAAHEVGVWALAHSGHPHGAKILAGFAVVPAAQGGWNFSLVVRY